jgi:hypothetical protein
MIIWDTGEYEILPYRIEQPLPETDDSRSDISSDTSVSAVDEKSDSEKLRQSFQNVCYISRHVLQTHIAEHLIMPAQNPSPTARDQITTKLYHYSPPRQKHRF